MEKGSPLWVSALTKDGGLIRVNGLDVIRRRERMPIRLPLGDLPAAAGAESIRLALEGDVVSVGGVDIASDLRF